MRRGNTFLFVAYVQVVEERVSFVGRGRPLFFKLFFLPLCSFWFLLVNVLPHRDNVQSQEFTNEEMQFLQSVCFVLLNPGRYWGIFVVLVFPQGWAKEHVPTTWIAKVPPHLF